MLNEIKRTSREKRGRMSASLADLAGWQAASQVGLAAQPPLRDLRHALAVYPNFADAFYPGEDVIHSLTAKAHEF